MALMARRLRRKQPDPREGKMAMQKKPARHYDRSKWPSRSQANRRDRETLPRRHRALAGALTAAAKGLTLFAKQYESGVADGIAKIVDELNSKHGINVDIDDGRIVSVTSTRDGCELLHVPARPAWA